MRFKAVLLVVGVLVAGQLSTPALANAASGPGRPSPTASAHPAKPTAKPTVRTVNHGLHGAIKGSRTHPMLARAQRRAGARAAAPPAPPTADDNLSYDSGPVMRQTTTYLIFWNPAGSTISAAAQQLETQFLTDLGGRYYGIMSQYYQDLGSGQQAINPLTHFGGSAVDARDYPHAGTQGDPVTDADVQNETQQVINDHPEWNAPGLSTLYEVVLGEGIEFCDGNGNCSFAKTGKEQLCAYHGTFNVNGTDVVYANDGNMVGRPCQSGLTTPNDTDADADVSTLSHETFEAITDPLLGAWRTPSGKPHAGEEIGDLCGYQYGTTSTSGANLVLNGHEYQVQQEWSNDKANSGPADAAYAGCDVQGGAIQSGTAYPACTANTLPANDDGSTGAVTLPFTVNFFSRQFDSLYVNNNGNVTFDGPQSTYTPYGLQSTAHEIIAPYFADVDTRGVGSSLVSYGGDTAHGGQPAYFCVDWNNVGYYGAHTDRLNSFQLLLIDRSAQTGLAGDFDIVFNYDKVQWETGDASNGSGGLGGSPAVVGYSNGSNASLELFGSGLTGSFVDGGLDALVQGSRGSDTPGRYLFPVRNSGAPTGGAIHGTVTTDLYATIVRGAPVQICSTTSGACTLTATNDQGRYSVSGLPTDTYQITVQPPSGSLLMTDYSPTDYLPANGDITEDLDLVSGYPLPDGADISYHRVTANGIPILEWGAGNTLNYYGCPDGTASGTIALNSGAGTRQVPMQIDHFGVGEYQGAIPDFRPLSGAATVTITTSCPNPADDQTVRFSIYIDPSGVVVDGTGAPIGNATVTLLRSDSAGGPFLPVPDGSALMSPANRANPDTTTSDGTFGWDVLTGYYEVQASKDGCSDPANPGSAVVTSAPFQVPPPVADLRLVLNCQPVDTTPPQLTVSPLTLQANTTGGYTGPLSGVTVSDPDDAAGSITVTNDAPTLLPTGTSTVTYQASDPAGNHASAQQTVTVLDTVPPAINCPAAVSRSYTAGPALGTATASDIEDPAPVIGNDAPASFPPGSTVVTWTATDRSGNHASCSQQVTLSTVDSQVSVDGASNAGRVVTPAFNTSGSNEILLAMVGSDGPGSQKQTVTVAGAGLSWTLVSRANGTNGDSEIWTATASGPLTGVTVRATQAKTGYHESLTVLALRGASGLGANAHVSASTGAPTVSLSPQSSGSLVFAMGEDWTTAGTRTLPAGQSLLHEFSDTDTQDDYWMQRVDAATTAGQPVTVRCLAPSTDRWNLNAVEVRWPAS